MPDLGEYYKSPCPSEPALSLDVFAPLLSGMLWESTIREYHSHGVPFGVGGIGMPTPTKFV